MSANSCTRRLRRCLRAGTGPALVAYLDIQAVKISGQQKELPQKIRSLRPLGFNRFLSDRGRLGGVAMGRSLRRAWLPVVGACSLIVGCQQARPPAQPTLMRDQRHQAEQDTLE